MGLWFRARARVRMRATTRAMPGPGLGSLVLRGHENVLRGPKDFKLDTMWTMLVRLVHFDSTQRTKSFLSVQPIWRPVKRR